MDISWINVNNMSFVYFIESTNGATYIGATVNLDKRIRQHNKE